MTAGVLVAIVVLLGATAFGLARRRTDGRLREQGGGKPGGPRPPGSPATGREGRQSGKQRRLTNADLRSSLGERATLLQFSSSFCAPCRATRQVLADIANSTDGVAHVEIDVADRVDLVRTLDIRRTPTVFLLGPDGQITTRASGAPRREDVLAALGVTA